jgi:hypothetical protein
MNGADNYARAGEASYPAGDAVGAKTMGLDHLDVFSADEPDETTNAGWINGRTEVQVGGGNA